MLFKKTATTPEEQQDKHIKTHPDLKTLMQSTPNQIFNFVDNKIAAGEQAYLFKINLVALSFVLRALKKLLK